VSWASSEWLHHLVASYGLWSVAAVIALESMGVPVPGETALVLVGIDSGTGHDVNIWALIGAAAVGAIVGDNIGYWLGRKFGYALVMRYGCYVGLTEARIKLGQYIFMRHGGKVVFFGRFVAYLRVLAALLAGLNCMNWRRFLVANAAGGIVWALVFGWGAHAFGQALLHASTPVCAGLLITGAIFFVWCALFVRGHELELQAEAERALPGRLQSP
jgi:membrane protein DedA with SNARE-associated domain